MTDPIKTLVLDSQGPKWQGIAANTVLRGLLRLPIGSELPTGWRRNPVLRRLLADWYENLSYILDWREALCASPSLDVTLCNASNLIEYAGHLRSISRYDLIIILHSLAGDSMSLLLRTVGWFGRRRGKLVVFVGNEYDLMAQKIAFIQRSRADYVCSQLPLAAAQWLYQECPRTRVLALPHALNPRFYYPDASIPRTCDIGFVGDRYPFFIGDLERTHLIDFFQRQGASLGLLCKLRTGRMIRPDWAAFLRTCKAIIGGEAGTYYLDRQAHTLTSAKAFQRKNPRASFDDVFEKFFAPMQNALSGKAISSRHFEPIGTKTCQILLQGDYNGILRADEHYIAVNKDLSNVDAAIERFKDESYRTKMVDRAFEYVMSEHTYAHRVRSLVRRLESDGL